MVLLFSVWREVHTPLVFRDRLPESLLFLLEGVKLLLRFAAELPKPKGRRIRRRCGVRGGPPVGLRLRELSLQGGDFCLHSDHVRVLLAEAGAEFHQLLVQPGEPGGERLSVAPRNGPVAAVRDRRPGLDKLSC